MLNESHPLIRRILRFSALPYVYFKFVNWEICNKNKIDVIKDLLFIFFKLKYYPENYSICRLFEIPRNEWRYYYGSVYDAWQRYRLRKIVFPIKYRLIFDDKNICHKLCKAYNLPVPNSYGRIDKNNYISVIKKILEEDPSKTLIIKPTDGRGGKGICLAKIDNRDIYILTNNKKVSLNEYVILKESIVQEVVSQHPSLSIVSPSTNTIRIVTLLTKSEEILIVGALMRFGINNSFIDNTSQGGIAAGININNGKLKEYAFDKKGKKYLKHPTSGIPFCNIKVPCWEKVLLLAKKTQRYFSCNKMIGQDIAVTSNGPVIIELNAEYDNVGLEQKCGPILKNKKIREEFKNYNLLINKYQLLIK